MFKFLVSMKLFSIICILCKLGLLPVIYNTIVQNVVKDSYSVYFEILIFLFTEEINSYTNNKMVQIYYIYDRICNNIEYREIAKCTFLWCIKSDYTICIYSL